MEALNFFLGNPNLILCALIITTFLALALLNVTISSRIAGVQVGFGRGVLLSIVSLLAYVIVAYCLNAATAAPFIKITSILFHPTQGLTISIAETIIFLLSIIPEYFILHKLFSKHIPGEFNPRKMTRISIIYLLGISLFLIWGVYFALSKPLKNFKAGQESTLNNR